MVKLVSFNEEVEIQLIPQKTKKEVSMLFWTNEEYQEMQDCYTEETTCIEDNISTTRRARSRIRKMRRRLIL